MILGLIVLRLMGFEEVIWLVVGLITDSLKANEFKANCLW